jgi:predicted nucleic acid-binding Zn ribbon protein|tara:strand:- start:790 stop:1803 length:1014 start_codon:yes stop_codon:yes gene_type:complete
MKYCNKCGAKLKENTKFCNKCGNTIKLEKETSKNWILPVFLVTLIIISVSGYLVYYNSISKQGKTDELNKMDQLKQKQSQLDEEFNRQLQEKESSLIKQKQSTESGDQDNDGLTYSEEMSMNTDPYNPDSDADGIMDGEDPHPAGGGIIYKRTVHWQHNGRDYTTQFGIPEDWYLYYKKQPRGYCCDGWDKFATPNDITIKNIAKDIVDVSISTGDNCKICIAIDFVQSIIYEKDIDYNKNREYPKFAIETIIDEKGDCEDTSFLMASILEALDIDTILFDLPGHMAVGVYCNSCSGTYYTYKGRDYYFLETTGAPGSWEMGRTSYDLDELEHIIEV